MANKYEKIKVSPWMVAVVSAVMLGVLVLIIVLSGALVSAQGKIYNDYIKAQNYQGIKDEYKLSKEHSYVKITLDEAQELIESKQPIMLFIGSPDCPACAVHVGIYDQLFKSNEFLNEELGNNAASTYFKNIIYYVQMDGQDAEGNFVLEGLEKFMSLYGITSSGIPKLMAFNNNKLLEEYEVSSNTADTYAPVVTQTKIFFRNVIRKIK